MSIFDAYNSEFQSILEEIKKNINDLKSFIKTINLNEMSNKNDLKSSNTIKIIEALFSQSNELIKQMEVEVRSHDIITKKKLNEKLLSYKSSIGKQHHYDACHYRHHYHQHHHYLPHHHDDCFYYHHHHDHCHCQDHPNVDCHYRRQHRHQHHHHHRHQHHHHHQNYFYLHGYHHYRYCHHYHLLTFNLHLSLTVIMWMNEPYNSYNS